MTNERGQSGPVKLHVGCGKNYFEGWVNIDNNSDNNISRLDIIMDLRDPLPFPDNSVDYLYNEHFLEHLSLNEGLAAIREFFRVLKPGGVMRIAMPDLESMVAAYMDPDWKKGGWLQRHGLDFIETRAELLNINFRAWGHKWLYDWEELERRLKEAGCVAIKRRKNGQSVHEPFQRIETRAESTLIAEVTK